MKQQHIITGDFAFDPHADNLRDAMIKVESNFTELYQTAKAPAILMLDNMLPKRPDKNGLYLIDRYKWNHIPDVLDPVQFIQRYNLHFGKNNPGQFRRPIGDPDVMLSSDNEVHYLADKSVYCRGTPLWVVTGDIPIEPGVPVHVMIKCRVNNSADVSFVVNGYIVHSKQGAVSLLDFNEKLYFTWPNPNVSDLKLEIMLSAISPETDVILYQIIVFQPFHITGFNDRYLLMRYTGTEWLMQKTPDGVSIPIKGKDSLFSNKGLSTPAPVFPKLIQAYNYDPANCLSLKFDGKVIGEGFYFIFSRRNHRFIKRQDVYTTRDRVNWRRYTDIRFFRCKRDSLGDFISTNYHKNSYGEYRGHLRADDTPVISTGLRQKNRIEFLISSLLANFFSQPHNSSAVFPLVSWIVRRVKRSKHPYYFVLGFELAKKVNGKFVYGPRHQIKISLNTGFPRFSLIE